MAGDDYNVIIDGKPSGHVHRLGLGHVWVWEKAGTGGDTGSCTFDCGLAISHVLDYIAARTGCEAHAVKGTPR
jgi:hypothetical protein